MHPSVKNNNSIVTDDKFIANKLNNYFNSIATNIDSKIIQTKTNFQEVKSSQLYFRHKKL